jgi:hypothetical protein
MNAMRPVLPLTGGCQCGAIRYEIAQTVRPDGAPMARRLQAPPFDRMAILHKTLQRVC